MNDDNDGELFADDDELLEDIHPSDYRSLLVYSRDWTVGTILEQIKEGNINLDPEFQRRNAWNDEKRSGLIESLIVGIPVPQLVFAEDPEKRKSYIVIDGRQRLLTIAGFVNPEIEFWNKSVLRSLKLRKDLDGESYESLAKTDKDAHRELTNADVRCAVIASREETNDLLYYVFYRLNSGSVSLSTQELRQALSRGEFSRYLSKKTKRKIKLHSAMGLTGPDNRYRDSEVLLRYFAFSLFLEKYRGDLKDFLDKSMERLNKEWSKFGSKVEEEYKNLNAAIQRMESVFGKDGVGRRPLEGGGYDRRFNRALFEVEVYYFKLISAEDLVGKEEKLRKAFEKMFLEDSDFRAAVSTTTKALEQYRIRFTAMQRVINRALTLRLSAPAFQKP